MTIGQDLDSKLEAQDRDLIHILLKQDKLEQLIENLNDKYEELIKIFTGKFKQIIMYPSDNFDSIGGGATSVYDNVSLGKWSWEDVEKYNFCSFADLSYAAGSYSSTLFEKAEEVAGHIPVLSNLRHDLFYMYHEKGWDSSADMTPFPPVTWGEKPRDGEPWEKAIKKIESAGYISKGYSTPVLFPYQITLDAKKKEWSIRNAVMQVNNTSWIGAFAKRIVALRKRFPFISGYYVNTAKVQRYVPGRRNSRQLHEWIEGTANLGWDLATNLDWPVAGEIYDDVSSDMFDCINGSFLLVRKLRVLDPGAIIVYSGQNLYVESWRSTYYKSLFVSAFNSRFTTANALKWWENSLLDMKNYANYVEFPDNDHPEDFSKQWADKMRSSQWLKQPSYPQDISKI